MSVNHDTDLLLITCASGKQASHLLPLVYEKWRRLRLIVNSNSSEDRLKETYPKAEVTRADLCNPTDCHRIMTDVTTVLHIGPSFHPHETEIGYFMIDAAVSAGASFKHFVYSSVLDSQLRKLMNHDCKRYVEEHLFESGLNYTVLQPTHFMDMFPIAQLMVQDEPVYTANWSPEVTFSFLALRDLGEATAKVIEERERHYLAQYPLCSTGAYSYNEVIRIVSEVIGKKITIKTRGIEEGSKALMTMLYADIDKVPAQTRDAAHRLLLYYNHYGLKGNPNVLEWLLGRKTTTHEEWARGQVQKASETRK
ncbi:hypothetical protein N0V93_005202 [Gnomoniopsis smithogilvyi]|uniref:NmrA-like domain-containing protein n=1 Tax=Gnomoniopsis smithogilvyi TaxID=1191159 RepID=A0A9W8YUA8_9PEZI|nr:hypothetical protein N0V93_005202 [Gnomoniopsis smithogilvyi]